MERGYFTINSKTGYLARLEKKSKGSYGELINAIGFISKEIKINNIDAGRKDLLIQMEKAGFLNFIDQYEMEMSV